MEDGRRRILANTRQGALVALQGVAHIDVLVARESWAHIERWFDEVIGPVDGARGS